MSRFAPNGQRFTPYQKIARAFRRGSSVSLSYADVRELCRDDSILRRAEMDESGKVDEFGDPKPKGDAT